MALAYEINAFSEHAIACLLGRGENTPKQCEYFPVGAKIMNINRNLGQISSFGWARLCIGKGASQQWSCVPKVIGRGNGDAMPVKETGCSSYEKGRGKKRKGEKKDQEAAGLGGKAPSKLGGELVTRHGWMDGCRQPNRISDQIQAMLVLMSDYGEWELWSCDGFGRMKTEEFWAV